jgi:hypothetical protein
MTYGNLLRHWNLVELDFQEVYGIDLGEPGILRRRTWRWITLRVVGLLSTECRVQRVLNPQAHEKPKQ